MLSRHETLAQLQARYGDRYRWLLLAVMLGTMVPIMSSMLTTPWLLVRFGYPWRPPGAGRRG